MESNYISVRPYKHQVLKSENTLWNPVSFRKNKHFCQVRPVDVPSTDPEPVTSKTGTKNTLSTHVKPSIPYSLQVTIDPDGILTRETVQGMKDSLTRNDTVFNPILHRHNGQAGPFQARVNASTATGYLNTLVDSCSYLKPEPESMGVFQNPKNVGVTVE